MWRRRFTKKHRKHLFLVSELCAYLSFLDLADGGSREQYIYLTCLFTSEVEQLTQVGDESGFLRTATEKKDWKMGKSSCMCELRVYLARVCRQRHSCIYPSRDSFKLQSANVSISKSTRRNEEKTKES